MLHFRLERLERVHGFTFGDSMDEDRRSRWLDFRERLIKLLNIEEPWTLILDDALANSFIAPATDDIKDDHQLTCNVFLGRCNERVRWNRFCEPMKEDSCR
ncbi:hypothetical protein L1987_68583 [Smallanthus sonchifolius]|uniref:Uncharacterized protein n=1 Tax=Smallanthus sonchifolius TaxID=185202 RepID=A0ACB9B5W4_9ASTR|nr:hypothetical protein L1987_68583 [Smallanthus sonchifolius]